MRYLYFSTALLLSACILISGCGGLGKSETDYKKEAISINYEDVARNPDSFAKKAVFVTGIVAESKEENKKIELLLRDTSSMTKFFWISYTAKENEERFIKGDVIRIWGDFQKVTTRPIIGGLDQINTLDINAKYTLRPIWSSIMLGSNWFKDTFDGKKMELLFSIKNINENGINIQGRIGGGMMGNNFEFSGIIDDGGAGKVKYIDHNQNNTNIEATIKITKDTVEFETPEVKLEKPTGFHRFGQERKTDIVTLESGKYIFSRQKK